MGLISLIDESRPHVLVTVDGIPVSGLFFEKLVRLTVTDREGISADRIELVFDDPAPHLDAPRRGALVAVAIEAGARIFTGAYVVDRVELACFPHTVTVQGHSADFRGEIRTPKTKHWDNKTVADVVKEKAGLHGLNARISEAVSSHLYPWLGQSEESDLSFLERLAERHRALFSIKSGALLWLDRGAGLTAAGAPVPLSVIAATSLVRGSCAVSEGDAERFATVRAYWQDRAAARRQSVTVPADPLGLGETALRDPYSSEAEAKAAAEAEARKIIQGGAVARASVVGRPDLMAGAPFSFAGVRPGIDGRIFIASEVQHNFSKAGGLRTDISGRLAV